MALARSPVRPPQEAARKGAAAHMRGDKAGAPARRGVIARVTGVIDRGLGRVYGLFARVNHWMFMGGMFAGLFGRMKNVRGVGGAFGLAEKVAESPARLTMGQVGEFLAPSRLLARVLGKDGKLPESLGKAESTAASAVGKAARGVSGAVASGIERSRGAVLDPLAGRLEAGAARHADRAQTLLSGMVDSSKGNAALSGVRRSLEQASTALKGGNDAAYVAAMGQAQQQLQSAKGTVDKRVLKSLSSGIRKVGSATEKVGSRSQVASQLKNLPQTVKDAPGAFKNATVQGVVMKGALITGTAIQVTGTARSLTENISTLKSLYTDMTGEKKISTRKLLFGKNVPETIKVARSQLLKQFGPRVLLDAANIVATGAFSMMQSNGMSLQNKNMKVMLGSVGLSMANQMIQSRTQDSFLPVYDAISEIPEPEAGHYAALIAAASKKAADAGGVESPLVQELAVQYAREQLPPAEVLKEMESGRFDERALAIMEERRNALGITPPQESPVVTEAGRIAASAADPAGPARPLSRQEHGRLAEMEAQFGKNREVVGVHTQRLQNESRSHAQAVKI